MKTTFGIAKRWTVTLVVLSFIHLTFAVKKTQ